MLEEIKSYDDLEELAQNDLLELKDNRLISLRNRELSPFVEDDFKNYLNDFIVCFEDLLNTGLNENILLMGCVRKFD